MSAATEIRPIGVIPTPISSRLRPRSRSSRNPRAMPTARTGYATASRCRPNMRNADSATIAAGTRFHEKRGGALTTEAVAVVVIGLACHPARSGLETLAGLVDPPDLTQGVAHLANGRATGESLLQRY